MSGWLYQGFRPLLDLRDWGHSRPPPCCLFSGRCLKALHNLAYSAKLLRRHNNPISNSPILFLSLPDFPSRRPPFLRRWTGQFEGTHTHQAPCTTLSVCWSLPQRASLFPRLSRTIPLKPLLQSSTPPSSTAAPVEKNTAPETSTAHLHRQSSADSHRFLEHRESPQRTKERRLCIEDQSKSFPTAFSYRILAFVPGSLSLLFSAEKSPFKVSGIAGLLFCMCIAVQFRVDVFSRQPN